MLTTADAWLYFANGLFIQAKSFGSVGTKVGEVVFNTSMSGYQEIMSDPSYAGQFVVFTMPEIGNVGCNKYDKESDSIHACGMIVRNFQSRVSNFRSQQNLSDYLKEHDSFGICDIDTRSLTKMIRDNGPMPLIVSTKISDKDELKKLLSESRRIEEINYMQQVSTKNVYMPNEGTWDFSTMDYSRDPQTNGKKLVVIDFGIKKSILRELKEVGFDLEVIPSSFNENTLITRFKAQDIDGIFLSNGPGDPSTLKIEIEKVKKLCDANIPIFAICLGHQLLSLAHGYPTYKLDFGQHGANHPVKNKYTSKVEITAQNHNYNVPDSICSIAEVSHVNLFDGTIEGLKYKNAPIMSVQHHPEGGPGPSDSKYIFNQFISLL